MAVRRCQQTDLSAEAQAFLHHTLGMKSHFVVVRLPFLRSPWRTGRPKSLLRIVPFRILSSISGPSSFCVLWQFLCSAWGTRRPKPPLGILLFSQQGSEMKLRFVALHWPFFRSPWGARQSKAGVASRQICPLSPSTFAPYHRYEIPFLCCSLAIPSQPLGDKETKVSAGDRAFSHLVAHLKYHFLFCALAILAQSLGRKETISPMGILLCRRGEVPFRLCVCGVRQIYPLGSKHFRLAHVVRWPFLRSPWATRRPKSPLGIVPFRTLSRI